MSDRYLITSHAFHFSMFLLSESVGMCRYLCANLCAHIYTQSTRAQYNQDRDAWAIPEDVFGNGWKPYYVRNTDFALAPAHAQHWIGWGAEGWRFGIDGRGETGPGRSRCARCCIFLLGSSCFTFFALKFCKKFMEIICSYIYILEQSMN